MSSRHVSFLRLFFCLGAVCGALLLGGCVSNATPSSMVPTSLPSVTKHAGSVSLNVTGSPQVSSMGVAIIKTDDFAGAIKTAITQSEVFAKLVPAGEADDFHLEVLLVRIDQPMFGFNMTVTVESSWLLTHSSDKSVIWQKAVISTYTATTGDAFVGATRVRLANEGAARTNIQDALKIIGALPLP